MAHLICSVKTLEKSILLAIFMDGTQKKYDISQLFDDFPQFILLDQDEVLFRQVKVDMGGYGVSWNDELDLSSEEIWSNGEIVEEKADVGIHNMLGASLSIAREKADMTQKQLAEKTGIYQADISKIERGLGNPSIVTLKRLADGMNMILSIEFQD